MGNLTKDYQVRLLKSDAVYKEMALLNIVSDKSSKQIMFDFLILFQSTDATEDESITEIIASKPKQLKLITRMLNEATQTTRDQRDLNESPSVKRIFVFEFFIVYNK